MLTGGRRFPNDPVASCRCGAKGMRKCLYSVGACEDDATISWKLGKNGPVICNKFALIDDGGHAPRHAPRIKGAGQILSDSWFLRGRFSNKRGYFRADYFFRLYGGDIRLVSKDLRSARYGQQAGITLKTTHVQKTWRRRFVRTKALPKFYLQLKKNQDRRKKDLTWV